MSLYAATASARQGAGCGGGARKRADRALSDISSTKTGAVTMLLPVVETPSTGTHRRSLLVACIGVIFGFSFACVKGPTLVSWLFKPLQDSFSCSASVNQALTQFVELQLTCAVVGAVSALAGLFFWRRFLRRRAAARQGT